MKYRCAILDDYQNVALSYADWSSLAPEVDIKIFNQPFKSTEDVHRSLQGFQIICMMRERTAFLRNTLEALPDLKLLITTGAGNKSIDLDAAAARGITVAGTGTFGSPTTGVTFGLILELTRRIGFENTRMKAGAPWQVTVGQDIEGLTLGVIGLGKLGRRVVNVAKAFGMKVIAWSQNLTTERAAEVGATLVSKDKLFQEADVVTIHLVLSGRTRGLVGAAELALMKPTARLVNTSRGPIVVEADLVEALKAKTIAGAAIDVFDQEPLPLDHPFRALPNLLATPHIGYVSRGLYARFYQDTVANICRWLDGQAAARHLEN